MKKIVIIGGGLAGLISAVNLAKAGIPCLVIEKKTYPFHRVCGEYISNEALPFLSSLGLYPEEFAPPQISRFMLSSIRGKAETLPLDLGGFGISRYAFDHFVYQQAKGLGVEFALNTEADNVQFEGDKFHVSTAAKIYEADVVIGAFGKRSKLDIQLNRDFTRKRSPYVGIKYHVRTDHPDDLVALHNFPGGYCGVCRVEDGKTNLCYLTHRDLLRQFRNVPQFQENVLYQNPFLKSIFTNADFIFRSPETINEISFETKLPVDRHILMTGDSAGMITPLCGNGMAMAIHSAKILSEQVIRFCREASFSRAQLEKNYEQAWTTNFSRRLWTGRQVQRLFGQRWASSVAVNLTRFMRPLAAQIIRKTHGPVF